MATRTFQNLHEWHCFTEGVMVQENRCKHLELLHVNIRSLRKHWNELIVHLAGKQQTQVDILVLTETNNDETSWNT